MTQSSPLLALARDSKWTDGRGPVALQIGLATFGILALELALIRWTSGQVRVFAYFNNLVLIAAFLGMGLGIALGRRFPGLVHWALPALLLLSLPLGFSEALDLVRLPFPDKAVSLWGVDVATANAFQYGSSLAAFLALFVLIVVVFVFAGAPVGHLFSKIPTLRAYSADLLGSLLGIVVFTLATFLNATPPIWLLIGGAPFLWLSRKPATAAALAATLVLAWHSMNGAAYSPYNRIDLTREDDGSLMLIVNRDFHQFMYDLSDANLARPSLTEQQRRKLARARDVYDIPFQVNDARRGALVVGAGTGNDVRAALRNGYESVISVDIDGRIIDFGKQLHPERVYSDGRVIPVVNDARAFFEQYDGEPFDVICYGLLDSHAMFSAMSSLRLDNYVYSEQGIRSAWKHVSERGHLSISFSVFAGDWIADRLYWTITRATGRRPIAVRHGLQHGATYVVARDPDALHLERLARYPAFTPRQNIDAVRTVSDEWPFLYLRPGVFPLAYLIVLTGILIMTLIATPLAFGRKALTSDFDPLLFFMGAGFLLIETRAVTSLSLLFGSTWLVNAAIFSSILTLVLLANLAVERFRLQTPLPWFLLLLISVTALWAFDVGSLNQYSLLGRGLLGGFLTALPIGFAGIIVSILLSRSAAPSGALGSNLLGAVVGGCLEYLSMYMGLKTIVLIALGLYLLALLFLPLRIGKPALERAFSASPSA